jgi:hypothetical protein
MKSNYVAKPEFRDFGQKCPIPTPVRSWITAKQKPAGR